MFLYFQPKLTRVDSTCIICIYRYMYMYNIVVYIETPFHRQIPNQQIEVFQTDLNLIPHAML